MPRLGALGITACVQPPHPPGAMDFPLSTMDTVIHRDRWRDAYLCEDAGRPRARRWPLPADWPVTDVCVMRGIQAALTRVPYDGAAGRAGGADGDACAPIPPAGPGPRIWTSVTGTLVPGLAADLVLIDGDIEAIPRRTRLGETGIALTVAGGG